MRRNTRVPTPNFAPGDRVQVRGLGEGVVEGLSPSTRRRRSGGEWRYRVRVAGEVHYVNESAMEAVGE